ncbi:DNA binding domain with preference for A/T rich regions-like protein [Purpureocillium lilacinum]|uniref:DNA binding domain with preference for A/T rich regions-like protein n=1 Tax=Purpureocillium lilacinum TaxID=33203 RepID=A0A179HM66_PURLI|nr:DNA binding domain with preference for A/T rich regions-like protein [Purpureocillium lilacinum]OAQ91516.1 DNA binding domain with preference for A/T rich regions-like protein [Purpureocillium lilacinum]
MTRQHEIDEATEGEQTANGNGAAEDASPGPQTAETTTATVPAAQVDKSPSAQAPTLTQVIVPAPALARVMAPGPRRKSKTPIQDVSNSIRIHVDGRVKNPIPSRIQHIAKKDSGNFSVMHIGVSGTMSEDPDAAARRTSERTAAQARQASQGGWQPPKRSRAAWHTDGPDTPASRLASQPPAGTPRQHQQPPLAGPPPQEAKSEQARLLTLLRTLHPLLVVDQLCKALAYFGGIPGAPPPADGVFPQSATKNGPGSLLVGWLSEIFPHVENPGSIAPPLQLPPRSSAPDAPNWGNVVPSGTAPGKRPRGRPKGSKSSKARKDKGLKKSRPATLQSAGVSQPTAVGDRDEIGDATSNTPAAAAALEPLQPAATETEASAPDVPASNPNPDSSIISTPGGRKRGRPKGSKNRPKSKPDAPQETPDQQGSEPPAPAHQSPNTAPPTFNAGQSVAALPAGGLGSGSPPRNLALNNGASLPSQSSTRAAVPFVPSSQSPSQPHGQHTRPPVLSKAPHQNGRTTETKKRARAAESSDQVSTEEAAHQDETAGRRQKAPKAKRRRVTKDTNPGHVTGAAQSTEQDTRRSQAVSQSFVSETTTQPTSRSFDSQDSVHDSLSTRREGTVRGSPQQHRHQHQQQHQQTQQQQFGSQQPNASPTLTGVDRRAHPPMQATSSPQRRDATTTFYGLQAHSGMSPQMVFAQQQRQEQQRQEHRRQQQQQYQQQSPQPPQTTAPQRTNANMSHGVKPMDSHPQYRQNMAAQAPFGSAVARVSQQRNMGAGRGQRQGPPQQPVARQSQGGANQSRSQLQEQQLGEMNSFASSYGEQSFLNMDYGLTERDLQDAEAVMGRHGG